MAEIAFGVSMFLVFYVYAGYPLAVVMLGTVRNRRGCRGKIEPMVTVLIAAYNEEEAIAATVRNKLAQDYAADRLEVLVVSDGSSDRTDELVKGLSDPRVRLIRQELRCGKTSALNLGVPHARGEILVFSDANSLYAPDAVRQLVANFSDPEVGYVSGRMIYANPEGTAIGDGCSAYMRYENWLRSAETRLGSIVGVDGGIDAVRRDLFRPMNPDQLPDFILPLRVVTEGYRVVYEPRALLYEPALGRSADEYRMRVRVSLRALWALWDMRRLLIGGGGMLFAWQLWSHKVLRYLCFVFLVGAWLANWALLEKGRLFQVCFALQSAAWLGALLSPLLEKQGHRVRLLALSNYFALLNLASGHAFGKFLLGRKQVLWTPRKG
jgi:cellulose synthase/poly-beta-1,6-N-acetylglucosamine synthase-like glycosyltransferase